MSKLSVDYSVSAANFVTSDIPEGFEMGMSDEVVLYGMWQKRMKKRSNVPPLGRIVNYYDVGRLHSVLHFEFDGVRAVPHRVYSKRVRLEEGDELDQTIIHDNTGSLRGMRSSFARYFERMSSIPFSEFYPRMVTVDEVVDLEGRILPIYNQCY